MRNGEKTEWALTFKVDKDILIEMIGRWTRLKMMSQYETLQVINEEKPTNKTLHE